MASYIQSMSRFPNFRHGEGMADFQVHFKAEATRLCALLANVAATAFVMAQHLVLVLVARYFLLLGENDNHVVIQTDTQTDRGAHAPSNVAASRGTVVPYLPFGADFLWEMRGPSVAEFLCGAMWAFALWSAGYYVWHGSRADNATRETKRREMSKNRSSFTSDDDAEDGERAAAFAKAAKRQARGMRVRAAISHILDSSSGGVRTRTRKRSVEDQSTAAATASDDEGVQDFDISYHDEPVASYAPPPSPSLMSAFTAAKRSKKPAASTSTRLSNFKSAIAAILDVSYGGFITSSVALLPVSTNSEAQLASTEQTGTASWDDDDDDDDDTVFNANVHETSTFSKMLEESNSGLFTAKRRHSRRSIS